MKKVFLISIIVMALCFVGVFSTSINDLVNSYNYSYSMSGLNLTVLSQNHSFNYLNLSLKINSEKIKSSIIFGAMNSSIEVGKIKLVNLSFGENLINLSLNISNLNSGNYSIYLFIYNNNSIIYRNYNISLFNIYGKPYISNSLSKPIGEYYIVNSPNSNYNPSLKSSSFSNNSSIENFSNISVSNVYYNQSSGNAKVIIKNSKNLSSSAVLEIYENNSSNVLEKIIPVVNPNSNLSVNLNLSKNDSKFIVRINSFYNDYPNLGNSIFIWPNFLKENNSVDNKSNLVNKNNSLPNKSRHFTSSESGGSSSFISSNNNYNKSPEIKGVVNQTQNNNLDKIGNSSAIDSKNTKKTSENTSQRNYLHSNSNKSLVISSNQLINKSNNITQINSNENLTLKSINPSKNFIEKNKVSIGGIAIGFVSVALYFLLF